MTVNKVRGRGSYAPLSAHAYKDDALAEAGEAAELLFYRGLSFAADVINDGFITESQLLRLVGWGMRDVRKRADRLVEVGLWVREEKGYRIASWLKWNRSTSEIRRLQEKDAGRKTNSVRTPDGAVPPSDPDSDGTPNGIQSESDGTKLGVVVGFQTPTPTPEPDTDTTPETSPRSARKRAARSLPDDWQPNDNHRAYASQNNINLNHESEQFRQHARANDRRQVDWDAAFRTWLGNNVSWSRAKPQGQPPLSRFVEQ